mmetsp:Transcript_139726/g.243301  ORF Transcript_139726/g.243301 Transcript_139726/m.243301 type:complete len:147 (+) Transcript_139726:160-600(+)
MADRHRLSLQSAGHHQAIVFALLIASFTLTLFTTMLLNRHGHDSTSTSGLHDSFSLAQHSLVLHKGGDDIGDSVSEPLLASVSLAQQSLELRKGGDRTREAVNNRFVQKHGAASQPATANAEVSTKTNATETNATRSHDHHQIVIP